MKIIIRKATPEDALHIATIHVETWQHAYQGLIPNDYLDKLSIPERAKKWKEMLTDPEVHVIHIVGLVDDQILGWASLCKCRDEDAKDTWGELGGMYVHPKAQKKGLGTLLMAESMELLKKERYTHATLWVLKENTNARKFYESKGWRVEGKTKIDQREGFDLHETRYIIEL